MSKSLRLAVTSAVAVLLLSGCGSEADGAVPEALCGTPVDSGLSRPLLEPLGKVTEVNRVERAKPQTAPCDVYVARERALDFRFAWHKGSAGDLLRTATESATIYRLTDPKRVDMGFQDSVLGNEGAIATTACKTPAGDHFTLRVFAKRADPMKSDLRPAIDAFMRTYMAETVKTLNCA
ncbi:hypothetical protein DEJ50_09035 [Streptomyces venezuelae]|uniref:DUF3558 domain-containing protein n=1 Tax=Streptomyces venezuelae TaxID=54571 RepID=A0A5P2D1L3_STRVZ|nr:hypothetical protein [Streptomyces venezuelae]QES47928.1 hypothetical protein DEJ50_09035 [Streptomyces venezuelae]